MSAAVVAEDDALDVLGTLSLPYRRLDRAVAPGWLRPSSS